MGKFDVELVHLVGYNGRRGLKILGFLLWQEGFKFLGLWSFSTGAEVEKF